MSKALVVHESMYGNTRAVAEAIAEGLGSGGEVEVSPVHEVSDDAVAGAELLVVGGPTHMHGMASKMSRKAAVQAAEDDGIEVEPGATQEPSLRTWLARVPADGKRAATFDTRIDKPPALTGVAARGIAKRLRRRGCELVAGPESFFVEDSEGPLAEGELERAREWGRGLASLLGQG